MDALMDIVTAGAVWLGDVAFAALSIFSPVVTLWIISALLGVAMLLIWRYTSNQDAIEDVRRKISANLLATKLFKDNLSVTFRAQRQILWQAMRLLVCAIRPMIIMLIPFVLITVQIGLRYEFEPIPLDDVAHVTAKLKPGAKVLGPAEQILLPDELTPDALDPGRFEARKEVDWRLKAKAPGTYTITLGGKGGVEFPVTFGDGFERISQIRGGPFGDRLLYSAEPSIPANSIFESVKVDYERRTTPIFGFEPHWIVTLLVLSIVFALLFKPFFKVHI